MKNYWWNWSAAMPVGLAFEAIPHFTMKSSLLPMQIPARNSSRKTMPDTKKSLQFLIACPRVEHPGKQRVSLLPCVPRRRAWRPQNEERLDQTRNEMKRSELGMLCIA